MHAAVLHAIGDAELAVHSDVTTAACGPDHVRIRLHAAGLCHSDLSAMSGVVAHPAPFVPGHEGSGEIVEVGDGVVDVAVGDRVVVCWMPPCGRCAQCRSGRSHLCRSGYRNIGVPNFEVGGAPVPGLMGEGTFAEEAVIPANAVIPIPDDLPYDLAALIGCGITTGIGAALNSARVRPGSSVAVIGLGGVGISILQGAKVAGAAQILAVDPVAGRREWALRFGATAAVAPEDLEDAVASITDGTGFDYAFEAVGRPGTLRAAYEATRLGGTVCLVGVGRTTDFPEMSLAELVSTERRLIPSFYGGRDVRQSVETVIDLWRAGRIDLAAMITHRVPLAGVNEAIRQMRTGEALRTVIELA